MHVHVRVHVRVRVHVHVHVYARVHVHVRVAHVGIILRHQSRRVSSQVQRQLRALSLSIPTPRHARHVSPAACT